ncbi:MULTISPECIES: histidine triad nucleotide-binding protein [Pandoraea]|uniref:HIT family hydrolase n=4 Tax=Pandoraea TaxID=93217 RepID=A0A5E4YIZ8_9BURK|nr:MULTISPECIES: histidine triad nucleotide-binding protein [Pandoraea]AJC15173.1 histidine triad nucleotide-binding protein [Pandoraea sputorum]UVA79159.1 histidine triad nucleotide-binding protein [Pandoraea commovens]SNU89667.1 HIT-like protein HI_0961 [Pandoraea sputorum]VVE19934.1 HIT family hydrolase [Pandoraea sputorum]VVE48826.1 HIT family hydrolase [Pandoraea commovens]
MTHDNCIFCKIVAGQIPSAQVYSDDDVVVFKDINPAADLHLLMVPRKHIATLQDCQPEDQALLGKMMLLAPKLAREQGYAFDGDASNIDGNGFRVVMNTGPGGGQEVYHLHMHILAGPRPWKRM